MVTRAGLSENYRDLRKRLGLELDAKTISKTALSKQLTKLIKIIFREEITMQNADVTYLLQAIINTKDRANEAGKFVKRNERSVVNAIFRAMYTRKNSLPYEFQDKTRADKDPLTVKANKDMAEEPKKDKPAKVTSEKVEAA